MKNVDIRGIDYQYISSCYSFFLFILSIVSFNNSNRMSNFASKEIITKYIFNN